MVVAAGPDEAGDDGGGGRAGQADEHGFVGNADLDVEAGEAQRGAGGVDEGGEPAQFGGVDRFDGGEVQRPLVDDDRRGDAEGDEVGERVVLHAEFGFGVGEAGDAAVAAVEDHGDEDEDGGEGEAPAAVNRRKDGVEAAKERGGGEEVGQDVNGF